MFQRVPAYSMYICFLHFSNFTAFVHNQPVFSDNLGHSEKPVSPWHLLDVPHSLRCRLSVAKYRSGPEHRCK